jgi:hypothetical protein
MTQPSRENIIEIKQKYYIEKIRLTKKWRKAVIKNKYSDIPYCEIIEKSLWEAYDQLQDKKWDIWDDCNF